MEWHEECGGRQEGCCRIRRAGWDDKARPRNKENLAEVQGCHSDGCCSLRPRMVLNRTKIVEMPENLASRRQLDAEREDHGGIGISDFIGIIGPSAPTLLSPVSALLP